MTMRLETFGYAAHPGLRSSTDSWVEASSTTGPLISPYTVTPVIVTAAVIYNQGVKLLLEYVQLILKDNIFNNFSVCYNISVCLNTLDTT